MDDSTSERFWAKVEKTDGCWNWTAGSTHDGYGRFRIGGRAVSAHRHALLMAGVDPAGWLVDHTCHNPRCVRPEHLRLVTDKQNAENLVGAHRDNPSGVRGVSWDKKKRNWDARVHSAGTRARKRFQNLSDAEAWVRERRLEMYTHNDADRVA